MNKILVVDDDEAVLFSTTRILEASGHCVVTASSAHDGLKLLAEDAAGFQLLLLDLAMPEMTGGEMAAIVVEKYKLLPILFVSGFSADSVAPEVPASPNVGFLAKPFTIAQLTRAIANIVNRK